MDLTKRSVLRNAGVIAGGLSSVQIVSADNIPDGRTEQNPNPSRNFGVFNNSTMNKSLELTALVAGNRTYRQTFELRGLNESAVEDPSESWFKGNLIVPTSGVPDLRLRIRDGSGRTAETDVTVKRGGISDFSRILAKVTVDGSLELKEVLR